MKHTLYRPCSKLIKFYPYLEKRHEIVAEYGFKYFKVDVNHVRFFDEEKTFKDFIARSRWQSHIDRYYDNNKMASNTPVSLQILKDTISDLYSKFRNAFMVQRQSGKKLVDMFYTADIGLLRECDQEGACINLAGQISLSFYPDRQKFDIKQIGAFYETNHVKNKYFKRNLFAEAIKTNSAENIEDLVSTSKHIVSVKNLISQKFDWKTTAAKNKFNSKTEKCDSKTASQLSKTIFEELLDVGCGITKGPVSKVNNKPAEQRKQQHTSYNSLAGISNRKRRDATLEDLALHKRIRRYSNKFEDMKFSRFKDEFGGKLQQKMDVLAEGMVARDFERSACMLDKLKSDKNERTRLQYWESLTYDNFAYNLYNFLQNVFGGVKIQERIGYNGRAYPCEYCSTSIMKVKAQQFADDVKQLQSDIESHYAKKPNYAVSEPFVRKHDLGEYGYIYYEMMAFNNDFIQGGSPSNQKKSVDCLFMPNSAGCGSVNNARTKKRTFRKPEDIHLALFVHYSERKIDKTNPAISTYLQDMNIENRIKSEQIEKYFEYNLIRKMYSEARNRGMLLKKPYIEEEYKLKNVLNDLDGKTRRVCPKVIDTMEACFNKNGKNRHFIFVLDGSGSISTSQFKQMKETLRSMLFYPLNGQNKVSVIEFSNADQQRILCRNAEFVEQIEACLDVTSNEQFKQYTHFGPAINYVKDNLLDQYMNNVIIYFTDGIPSDGNDGCYARKKLQSMSRVTSQTAYGIGNVFIDASAVRFLGNECLSSDTVFDLSQRHIADYARFDRERLYYQHNICKLK